MHAQVIIPVARAGHASPPSLASWQPHCAAQPRHLPDPVGACVCLCECGCAFVRVYVCINVTSVHCPSQVSACPCDLQACTCRFLIHTHTTTYACAHRHTCTHACTRMLAHVRMHGHLRKHTYSHMHIHKHTCFSSPAMDVRSSTLIPAARIKMVMREPKYGHA